MKHACSICNLFFKNRDAVIKLSPAVIQNASSAYMDLDESFDDEDIIHINCLKNYAGEEKLSDSTKILNVVESPKEANQLSEPVQNDKIDNSIMGLKALGVSHTEAIKGVERMLKKNSNLTTQELLSQFPYGG